ncbi:unnamed protein product [Trichogramma brassicae]|uniref:Uncharacterized protein n=1 Tax=Trichogramma brassicae TaxID=86971 RepID=A0A6H5I569_9HYME|nr:unnamed protein product [Trichogramma brassicae]
MWSTNEASHACAPMPQTMNNPNDDAIFRVRTSEKFRLFQRRWPRARIDPRTRIVKISANAAKKLTRLYLKYRKMVGSNGTMIAIRLVRSKLRKREDAQMAAAANVNGNNVVNSQSCDVEAGGGIVNRAMSVSSLSLDAANANAKNINGNCIRDAAFVAASIQAAAALQQDNNNTCNNNNNNNNNSNNNNTTSMLYAAASQPQNGTNQQQQQERPDCIWQFPPPFPPTKYKPPTFEMYNDQVSTFFYPVFILPTHDIQSFVSSRTRIQRVGFECGSKAILRVTGTLLLLLLLLLCLPRAPNFPSCQAKRS